MTAAGRESTNKTEPPICSHIAVVDQREYPAEIDSDGRVIIAWDRPDLPDGFEPRKIDGAPDAHDVVVRPDRLDGFYSCKRICRWRDHNFTLIQVNDDDTAVLFYSDTDYLWAKATGLTQESPGAWTAYVPVPDLEDLHEERTDRLASRIAFYRRTHADESRS